MTDFGQFQEPFGEVPLERVDPDHIGSDVEETAEVWWVDDASDLEEIQR
jgi:hypothetical protein